jgi:hypothetical protein
LGRGVGAAEFLNADRNTLTLFIMVKDEKQQKSAFVVPFGTMLGSREEEHGFRRSGCVRNNTIAQQPAHAGRLSYPARAAAAPFL